MGNNTTTRSVTKVHVAVAMRQDDRTAGIESRSQESREDTFWETDLSVIEESFLKGKKITDLEPLTDDRVPVQGNVLIGKRRFVNVDNYGKK